MSSVRTKRIVLLWLGTTFLILGGAASAVMSLVDPLEPCEYSDSNSHN